MFGRKRIEKIKNLQHDLNFYKNKYEETLKLLNACNKERFSLLRLFSSLFHRYSHKDVEKTIVDKPDDFNANLFLRFKDGTFFNYKIKLESNGYEEVSTDGSNE